MAFRSFFVGVRCWGYVLGFVEYGDRVAFYGIDCFLYLEFMEVFEGVEEFYLFGLVFYVCIKFLV